MIRLAVIVPTFKETMHVQKLLADLTRQTSRAFEVVIVNSNAGDETSRFLRSWRSEFPVREIQAARTDFWAGAVAKGMESVLDQSDLHGLLILNCDIGVPPDLIEQATTHATRHPDALICYAAHSLKGAPVTSGVIMRSWPLSLTRHVPPSQSSQSDRLLIRADMLAGRALLVPIAAARTLGLPAHRVLPHYGADYEYTRRAVRSGFRLYVATHPTVVSDTGNTGSRANASAVRLPQRVRLLTSLRSPSNLLYRSRFIVRTYPVPAILPGLLSAWAKTIVEILFGRRGFALVSRYHVSE